MIGLGKEVGQNCIFLHLLAHLHLYMGGEIGDSSWAWQGAALAAGANQKVWNGNVSFAVQDITARQNTFLYWLA